MSARPCFENLVALVLLGMLMLAFSGAAARAEEQAAEETAFEIRAFRVEGNTLFPDRKVQESLQPFTGAGKTAEDVDKARAELEKSYHQAGYISVMVNIPVPQTLEDGVVRLEVIESRVDQVRVTGNRYFTAETILRDLPSVAPGKVLYLPGVQEELDSLNQNQDLKAAPVLAPGRTPGTVDVELRVKDKVPLHGNLEVNNRSTHDTTELRINAMLQYTNLWQREHSVSVQYQTSPQDLEEVQVVAASYVLPVPWFRNHLLAVYGVWSDSDTSFGEGFQVIGNGTIFGARYVMLLPAYKSYTHNLTLGLDYKDLDENLGFRDGTGGVSTPVSYLPVSFAYASSLPDRWGRMTFSLTVNMAFRHIVTDSREFEAKRFEGRGNYIFATAGLERLQDLPAGFRLRLKADGQVSDQPLIPSEQYIAGGMESVRGYLETEEAGDDAMHGTVELWAPDLADWILPEDKDRFDFTPFVFYDRALLKLHEPLPGQCRCTTIHGTGAGVRGNLFGHLAFETSWAAALADTDRTEAGKSRVYFKVSGHF